MSKHSLFNSFLLGVCLPVGGWFLAHRHGPLKGFLDANRNGVDDRLETSQKAGEA